MGQGPGGEKSASRDHGEVDQWPRRCGHKTDERRHKEDVCFGIKGAGALRQRCRILLHDSGSLQQPLGAENLPRRLVDDHQVDNITFNYLDI